MDPWRHQQIDVERESKIKPNLSGLPHESLEEYLARGGQITKCPSYENLLFQFFASCFEEDNAVKK